MNFIKVFSHADIPFSRFKEGYDYILTKDSDSTCILSWNHKTVYSITTFCALHQISFAHKMLHTEKQLHECVSLFPSVNNQVGTNILQGAIRLNSMLLFKFLLRKNACFDRHTFVIAASHHRPEMMQLLLFLGCPAACTSREKEATELIQYRNRCAKKCTVILGLGKCRGKIQGNNRDVLRLIARELWKTILDQ